MTAPHRLQDLADVLRLIRAADLPHAFGARLDPYVRDKFEELWVASRHSEDDYRRPPAALRATRISA